ncbi:MAG TPA: tetratricopeptide repeat protein [Candidatus Binataceae bacterium]|nr:tetratricopeptide repeat protein [Candidatus Binataceae bacterium]
MAMGGAKAHKVFLALLAMIAAGIPAYAGGLDNMRAGVAARERGDHAEAIRDFTRALEADDLSIVAKAIVYNDRGLAYEAERQYDRAIADYNAALGLKPDFAEVYVNRGKAFAEKGEYDRVISDFSAAIRLNHESADAYENRGTAYLLKGEFDKAISDFDNAIRLRPGDLEGYYNRAGAYYYKGEYRKAIGDLSKIIRRKPNDAIAYRMRGNARFFSREFAAAATDYERCLTIDPSNSYVVLWLYLSRARMGKKDTASHARYAAKVDRENWPGPIVALYFGDATPEQVAIAATKGDADAQREHGCEAEFYLGEYALTRHDRDGAAKLLHQALETCPQSFLEYGAARSELLRMGE